MNQLYDAITSNGVHFSPYAWKVMMSLKHKGIEFEHIGLSYEQVHKKVLELTQGKWKLIPILKLSDGTVVYDSPNIADYLDKNFPGNSLYPNGRHLATFLEYNFESGSGMFKSVVMDMLEVMEDKDYFRKVKEIELKSTLEEVTNRKQEYLEDIENYLFPFRAMLKKTKFLEGDIVTYSDYVIFGRLKFIQLINEEFFKTIIFKNDDYTLYNWFESIQDLYDGFARSHKPLKNI